MIRPNDFMFIDSCRHVLFVNITHSILGQVSIVISPDYRKEDTI